MFKVGDEVEYIAEDINRFWVGALFKVTRIQSSGSYNCLDTKLLKDSPLGMRSDWGSTVSGYEIGYEFNMFDERKFRLAKKKENPTYEKCLAILKERK